VESAPVAAPISKAQRKAERKAALAGGAERPSMFTASTLACERRGAASSEEGALQGCQTRSPPGPKCSLMM
jgi:hypothetical protein